MITQSSPLANQAQSINLRQTPGQRLSPAQVEQYRAEGFLVVPEPVLSKQKFERLSAYTENMLADLPEDERPEDLDVPHFVDPSLFEWLFDDDVLDLVEPLLGPDIAVFSSHFICKPKGVGLRVPWHEDSFYWKRVFESVEVVTVWLAIDESNLANGAMQVVRGSHLAKKELEYEEVDMKTAVFGQQIKPYQIDPERVVTLELAPNHASLHDAHTFHGSNANTSDRRRCGFTMRYMSTKTRMHAEVMAGSHHLYLARGKIHAPNPYGDPTQSYPELSARRKKSVRRGH